MKQQLVKLYQGTDTPNVREFIAAKARNSRQTATTYRDGLKRLADYIAEKYPNYDIDSIIEAIKSKRKDKQIDVYRFLDGFVTYLMGKELSTNSTNLYIYAARSYLQYWDVDIYPAKFRHRVNMPKDRREKDYALDKKEIKKIITHIMNKRLRAFCLVMASCGCRPVEGLAIRFQDIDFSVSPTKIYIRAEYNKTKTKREVYISDEATEQLNRWIKSNWEDRKRKYQDSDLIFAIENRATPEGLYISIAKMFRQALKSIDFADKKDGVKNRHKITLYNFRRYVKTTIEDATSHSFSEYMIGHRSSTYYTQKEETRRALYKEKCMIHLTYLDDIELEQHGKNLESTIEELKSRLEKAEAVIKDKHPSGSIESQYETMMHVREHERHEAEGTQLATCYLCCRGYGFDAPIPHERWQCLKKEG